MQEFPTRFDAFRRGSRLPRGTPWRFKSSHPHRVRVAGRFASDSRGAAVASPAIRAGEQLDVPERLGRFLLAVEGANPSFVVPLALVRDVARVAIAPSARSVSG